MNPTDALYLIVEASLGLAGFAGVVTVLSKRGGDGLPVLLRLGLINLLGTALGALFFSLIALVMLSAGVEGSMVWRIVSAVGGAVALSFAGYNLGTVWRRPVRAEGLALRLLAINVPLVIVCAVQAWNAAVLGEFWPVLLLLTALFGIGCYSFVRLVFAIA